MTALTSISDKSERDDPFDAEPHDQRPVMKLGAYMPSTCHWMPSVASVTEWPQPTIASGAEVITMFIMHVADATPQATATMKQRLRAISDSGRPRVCARPRAAAAAGT